MQLLELLLYVLAAIWVSLCLLSLHAAVVKQSVICIRPLSPRKRTTFRLRTSRRIYSLHRSIQRLCLTIKRDFLFLFIFKVYILPADYFSTMISSCINHCTSLGSNYSFIKWGSLPGLQWFSSVFPDSSALGVSPYLGALGTEQASHGPPARALDTHWHLPDSLGLTSEWLVSQEPSTQAAPVSSFNSLIRSLLVKWGDQNRPLVLT